MLWVELFLQIKMLWESSKDIFCRFWKKNIITILILNQSTINNTYWGSKASHTLGELNGYLFILYVYVCMYSNIAVSFTLLGIMTSVPLHSQGSPHFIHKQLVW